MAPTCALVCARSFVRFVCCSFAQWETGLARISNTQNIFLKNLLGSAMSALVFFSVGYGFAFGEGSWTNPFIGSAGFALIDVNHLYTFFIQWSFANNAATIYSGEAQNATILKTGCPTSAKAAAAFVRVPIRPAGGSSLLHSPCSVLFPSARCPAGALAGRSRFMASMFCIIIITAIVYPTAAHWVWSRRGWMSGMGTNGVIDCSGGGPVHLLGGIFGLTGCIIIGPRVEYSRSLRSKRWSGAHNKLLAAGGAFLLWMGWLAFTSVTAASADPVSQVPVAGRVLVVTVLAGAAAAVSTFIGRRFFNKEYDLVWVANGLMAGCASITAPASVVQPWAAIIVGGFSSVLVHVASELLLFFDIDDPLDSSAVHITGGIWGLLAVGLFADPVLVGQMNGVPVSYVQAQRAYGLVYGGSWEQMGLQTIEVVSIAAWTLATAMPFFLILRSTGRLRVTRETEVGGLDLFKHGSLAYTSHDAAGGGAGGGGGRGKRLRKRLKVLFARHPHNDKGSSSSSSSTSKSLASASSPPGSDGGGGGNGSGGGGGDSNEGHSSGSSSDGPYDGNGGGSTSRKRGGGGGRRRDEYDVTSDDDDMDSEDEDDYVSGDGRSSNGGGGQVVIVSGIEGHPGTQLDRSNPIALALGGSGDDDEDDAGDGGDVDGPAGGLVAVPVLTPPSKRSEPLSSALKRQTSPRDNSLPPAPSDASAASAPATSSSSSSSADPANGLSRAFAPLRYLFSGWGGGNGGGGGGDVSGRRWDDDDDDVRLNTAQEGDPALTSLQQQQQLSDGLPRTRAYRSDSGSVLVGGVVQLRRYREEKEDWGSRLRSTWSGWKRSVSGGGGKKARDREKRAVAAAAAANVAQRQSNTAGGAGGGAAGGAGGAGGKGGARSAAAELQLTSYTLRARHMLAQRNAIANARIGLQPPFEPPVGDPQAAPPFQSEAAVSGGGGDAANISNGTNVPPLRQQQLSPANQQGILDASSSPNQQQQYLLQQQLAPLLNAPSGHHQQQPPHFQQPQQHYQTSNSPPMLRQQSRNSTEPPTGELFSNNDDEDDDDDDVSGDEDDSTHAEADKARSRRALKQHGSGESGGEETEDAAGVDISEDDRGLGDETLEMGTQRGSASSNRQSQSRMRMGGALGSSSSSSQSPGSASRHHLQQQRSGARGRSPSTAPGHNSGNNHNLLYKAGRSNNSVTFHPDVREAEGEAGANGGSGDDDVRGGGRLGRQPYGSNNYYGGYDGYNNNAGRNNSGGGGYYPPQPYYNQPQPQYQQPQQYDRSQYNNYDYPPPPPLPNANSSYWEPGRSPYQSTPPGSYYGGPPYPPHAQSPPPPPPFQGREVDYQQPRQQQPVASPSNYNNSAYQQPPPFDPYREQQQQYQRYANQPPYPGPSYPPYPGRMPPPQWEQLQASPALYNQRPPQQETLPPAAAAAAAAPSAVGLEPSPAAAAPTPSAAATNAPPPAGAGEPPAAAGSPAATAPSAPQHQRFGDGLLRPYGSSASEAASDGASAFSRQHSSVAESSGAESSEWWYNLGHDGPRHAAAAGSRREGGGRQSQPQHNGHPFQQQQQQQRSLPQWQPPPQQQQSRQWLQQGYNHSQRSNGSDGYYSSPGPFDGGDRGQQQHQQRPYAPQEPQPVIMTVGRTHNGSSGSLSPGYNNHNYNNGASSPARQQQQQQQPHYSNEQYLESANGNSSIGGERPMNSNNNNGSSSNSYDAPANAGQGYGGYNRQQEQMSASNDNNSAPAMTPVDRSSGYPHQQQAQTQQNQQLTNTNGEDEPPSVAVDSNGDALPPREEAAAAAQASVPHASGSPAPAPAAAAPPSDTATSPS